MHLKHAKTDHPIQHDLAARYSPYAFADRSVPPEELRSLFEAARWAASSYNEQPWRFLVARREDADLHARILSCLVEANQAWARHAPVLGLGLVARRFRRNGKPNPAAEHDLGGATATLTREATERGLAVHPMIGIVGEEVRKRFALPDDLDPLTGLAIGYAGDPSLLPDDLRPRDESPRTRMPLREFVFGDALGQPARFVG